jgi:hypothetical protein
MQAKVARAMDEIQVLFLMVFSSEVVGQWVFQQGQWPPQAVAQRWLSLATWPLNAPSRSTACGFIYLASSRLLALQNANHIL